MGKPQLVPVTKADKDDFLQYFIELLDKGVDDEYFFSAGQARVLEMLGLAIPAKITVSTNGTHTHEINLSADEEEEA
jgi:hypothetical protein